MLPLVTVCCKFFETAMAELCFPLYKSLSQQEEALKLLRVYVETWQRMGSQLHLQWLGTILEIDDTKKAGEIGEVAHRAERCLGKYLGRAGPAYSKHELVGERYLLSSRSLSSQSSNYGHQWSITIANFVMRPMYAYCQV